MSVLPTIGKNVRNLLGLPTGQRIPKSNHFCQENLTNSLKFLENRDTYLTLQKMGKLEKGAAFGAALSLLALDPALADDKNPQVIQVASNVSQQVDCVAYAKEGATRAEKKQRLSDCRVGKLDAVIAEQQRILTALNERLAELNLRIDEKARILDEKNQELARIVAINGQLVIQIEQTDQQIAQKLQEAERILQRLAAS